MGSYVSIREIIGHKPISKYHQEDDYVYHILMGMWDTYYITNQPNESIEKRHF